MITLRTLGKAEIRTPKGRLLPSQEIVFATSLHILIERPKKISRGALAEMLWPGVSDGTRQHRFRQTLLQMKSLGVPVDATRNSVSVAQREVESDLDVLFIHDAGDVSRVQTFQFLPGYVPMFSRAYGDWLDVKRAEVTSAATRVLLNEIRRARGRGDWLRVETLALKCMDVDPFNEEAVLARAEASAMRGSKREAISILDRYVADLGPGATDIKLPAALMRKRIAERVPESQSPRTDNIFVGREKDMQLLCALLAEARERRGRCCLLWGDPGIGKSRLAAELGQFAGLQGVQVRRVSCRRGDVHRPLSVFVEAVPLLRNMRGALGCSPDTLSDLQRLTQFDVSGSNKPAEDLDPQSIFELIRMAIFDLIDAVSEEQCLTLIVEDVQWLDAPSARILGQLTDWAASKRLLLIFTSRTMDNPLLDACTQTAVTVEEVRPISDDAATELVTRMFEVMNETFDAEFVASCKKIGDGNPFFLHELVRQWLETHQRHVIPPSITGVIRERFSRLGQPSMQVLQACAILGEHSTLPRVERMLGHEPYMLLTALGELSKAGMLSTEPASGGSGVSRLAPRHELVGTVAMEALDEPERIFLHRRAAEIIDVELDESLQETALLWACALHWSAAGEIQKSISLSSRYAEHFLEVGCVIEAADTFAKAMAYSTDEAERRHFLDRQIVALQMAHEWVAIREAIEAYRKAQGIDPHVHDDYELIEHDAKWRSCLNVRDLVEDLMPCVSAPDMEARHRTKAACLALKACSDLADPVFLDRIYHAAQPTLAEPSVERFDRAELELVYNCTRKDGKDFESLAEELVKAGRAANDINALRNALVNAAFANLMYGRTAEAEALFEEAYEALMSRKLHKRAWVVSLELVRLYLDSGNPLKAREWIDKFDHSSIRFISIWDRASLAFAGAKLAVAEKSVAEAEHHLAVLDEIPLAEQTIMRRHATLAIAVRLELLKGAPPSRLKPMVEELELCHKQQWHMGRRDYEAYSLYLGQIALGDRIAARENVRAYFQQRKERNRPLPELMEVISA